MRSKTPSEGVEVPACNLFVKTDLARLQAQLLKAQSSGNSLYICYSQNSGAAQTSAVTRSLNSATDD